MKKVLECVPNFSEGKDKKIIRKIAESIKKIPEISLLDIHSDIDHNRSVMTFIGPPEQVLKAAFEAVSTASKLIDISKHTGVHPRIGATDVLPLIPLKGMTYKECIPLAKKLGAKIGKNLKIPVYLYEKAATSPERRNLANIRKKGYESLQPDFGPKKAGKAGALALGVRPILIAFNVNLKSSDIKIAKSIAKKIREKDGGLPHVKALGLRLKSRKIVQISMNLTNYKKTGIIDVLKVIKKEAKKYKIEILENEIVGLIPANEFKKISNKIYTFSPLKQL